VCPSTACLWQNGYSAPFRRSARGRGRIIFGRDGLPGGVNKFQAVVGLVEDMSALVASHAELEGLPLSSLGLAPGPLRTDPQKGSLKTGGPGCASHSA